VVSLQVPSKELETTAVTLNEIIYHRRVRVLDHAGTHGVASTCRTFGIQDTGHGDIDHAMPGRSLTE